MGNFVTKAELSSPQNRDRPQSLASETIHDDVRFEMPDLQAGTLSDRAIQFHRDNAEIVIEPFNKEQLQSCAYDVTLGAWYYKPSPNPPKALVLGGQKSTFEYWCSSTNNWGAKRAHPLTKEEIAKHNLYDEDMKENDEVIIIPPRQVFLCHTNEYIGGVANITTSLKTRSSVGRSRVSTCKCAGWGDNGYFNRWTLEIENHNDIPVVLKVGSTVAQVIFHWTGAPERTYTGKKGQYQIGFIDYTKYAKSAMGARREMLRQCVIKLQEDWKPWMMLPGCATNYMKKFRSLDSHFNSVVNAKN